MLSSFLLNILDRNRTRVALVIDGKRYSYQELKSVAIALSETISRLAEPSPVAILTTRSLSAYTGVLAAALRDRPFLPLNADYPLERLARIIEITGPRVLVISDADGDRAAALRIMAGQPLDIILVNDDGRVEVDGDDRAGRSSLPDAAGEVAVQGHLSPARPAYMMFTSGTTGEPKGIVIDQANLMAYLSAIDELFDFRADDRFSQFFNLSFDLSVHDMFVAWMNGACLVVPNRAELMDPVGFARRHALTVWFSVPSAASLAMRFRRLCPDSLPGLRHGLFCGEALSDEVAKAFAEAAPNAVLTNLYGPAEATIAITHYRIPPGLDGMGGASSLPIGRAFPGQETLVLREDFAPVEPGQVGQLWLGGSQLAKGYINNEEETALKFCRFTHSGRKATAWYATGDLVEEHPDLGLVFHGRKDDQIKLRGHRIELAEVEEALRKAAGTPLAIIAPSPLDGSRPAETLIAVVTEPHPPVADVLAAMATALPPFMLPTSIISVPTMAFNANGKLDRKNTLRRLIDGQAQGV